MNGTLNIYYPCKIKDSLLVQSFNSVWNTYRKMQLPEIHLRNRPMTDLLDKKRYREMYNRFLSSRFPPNSCHIADGPYATKCLQMEYEKSRESKAYSKELSFVVSQFDLEYEEINTEDADRWIIGTVLFCLNLENRIGTYVLVLNFNGLSVDEVILLKHLFYKRAKVTIKERTRLNVKCECCFCKEECPWNENLQFTIEGSCSTTIPNYIMSLSNSFVNQKDLNIDFRARYSLLEIDIKWYISQAEIYGLLKADEGYDYAPQAHIEQAVGRNHSSRNSYDLYYSGLNGLIINHRADLQKEVAARNEFLDKIHVSEDDVEIVDAIEFSCIAGVGKNYPKFLRSVEIHYLVNCVKTSEIEERKISYWNPIIFFQREKRIWNVLYDLEMNRSHVDCCIINAFGVMGDIQDLREEHRALMSHTIGYFGAIFAVISVICAILQTIKIFIPNLF